MYVLFVALRISSFFLKGSPVPDQFYKNVFVFCDLCMNHLSITKPSYLRLEPMKPQKHMIPGSDE